MGCFGYICKGCGTSIRGNCHSGGEKCVMIHVRHGKEMGRVEGHYDEYGRVIEQEGLENEDLVFRGEGKGINSHYEICKSEFDFKDSHYSAINTKILNGKKVNARNFISEMLKAELGKHNYCPMKCNFYDMLPDCEEKRMIDEAYNNYKALKVKLKGTKDLEIALSVSRDSIIFRCKLACENRLHNYFYREFQRLKSVKLDKYSGIVAWHSKCYNAATEEQKNDLTPSLSDPDQSWGKVRKMYE